MPRGRVVACRASATAVNSMSITVFVLAFLAQASATPTAQAPSDAPASVSVVARGRRLGRATRGRRHHGRYRAASSACVQGEHVRERDGAVRRLASGPIRRRRLAPDMLPAGSGPAIGELRRPVTLKGGENPVVLFTFRKPAVDPRTGPLARGQAGAGSDRRGRHDQIPVPRTACRRSGPWIVHRCGGSFQD